MPRRSTESSDLALVTEVMQEAVRVMEEFPADFIPPDVKMPVSEALNTTRTALGSSVKPMLSDLQVQTWLQGIVDSWPRNLYPVFVEAGGILAQVIAMFHTGREFGMMIDPETLQMMATVARFDREGLSTTTDDADVDESNPIKEAMLNELHRRSVAPSTPFARTLTTFLGHDALLWLKASSRNGFGKVQPHEFSRTGWCNIWAIENQLSIEQELLNLEPETEYLGKIVVALCWTLTGLASFMPPAIFLGERTSHLSSMREANERVNYTMSFGGGGRTIITFEAAAMRPLVRILAEGVSNPLLSAADLMWMGAAMARVQQVHSGPVDEDDDDDETRTFSAEERFAVFLSHRGRDSKRPLSEIVQALPATHGIFLDCMTLPRGVINRSFVYGSLARAERILIVETENFYESAWCRKEVWFADALSRHRLAETERLTLPQAAARVTAVGPRSSRRRPSLGLQYPIAPRVLRDIDYWARTPNLYSLKEQGYPIESLVPLQSALEKTECPDDPAWVRSIGEAVARSLSSVVAAAPDAKPFELWATALQYSMAAFGSTSNARSKMEVRQGVDRLNTALASVVRSELHRDAFFRAQAPNHLALIAAASAINLAGFELDSRMFPALRIALGDAAGLRDGLLLLDLRPPGPTRTFRLHLIEILVHANLGSVGIVQDMADEVHRGRVGALPLDILPCVTLYPGMEAPFSSETKSAPERQVDF